MKKPLKVSEHALIRYIERAYGVDMDAVREQIRDHLKGACVSDNFKFNGFVVKEGTVVTYKGRAIKYSLDPKELAT